jgi:hypothetical protein
MYDAGSNHNLTKLPSIKNIQNQRNRTLLFLQYKKFDRLLYLFITYVLQVNEKTKASELEDITNMAVKIK